MNKKEKIAAYIEAYKEVFKQYCFLSEYINEDLFIELINTYEELFIFVLDIDDNETFIDIDFVEEPTEEIVNKICGECLLPEPHTLREKVEMYIDTMNTSNDIQEELKDIFTYHGFETLLKPYWNIENNMLDIPEHKKETLFYYVDKIPKEKLINIIAG